MTETSTSPPAGRFSRESEDGGGSAQDVKEQAQERVQEGAEKAKGALRSQVDERSTQAGQQVQTHASDARKVAEELRKQGQDGPAKMAEQAADRAERLGGYLERSDADTILRDVEDYARQNPWAVVAGGLAAGFLASRFLKAGSAQRSSGSGSGGATGGRAQLPQAPQPTAHPTPEPATASPGAPGMPASTPPVGAEGVGTTSVPGRPVT